MKEALTVQKHPREVGRKLKMAQTQSLADTFGFKGAACKIHYRLRSDFHACGYPCNEALSGSRVMETMNLEPPKSFR